MSNRTLQLTDRTYDYLIEHSLREPPLFRELREETARMPEANMQIAPEQGQYMALMIQMLGAKKTIEIGTFTGLSSLWVASALPADGRLLACDVSEKWTAIARKYWERAGLDKKIELHLGPALETLKALPATERGTYDFAFIDADKENYLNYYEAVFELLRPGGVIAIDNSLWSGHVADPAKTDKDTVAIRKINDRVHSDTRVTSSLLPLGDGLLLARKHSGGSPG